MTYVEARAMVHKERLATLDRKSAQRLADCNMSAGAREDLGALFHQYVSGIGVSVDHPSGPAYSIPTTVGALTVRYNVHTGTIFGRFSTAPQEAARCLGALFVNPHSGKWNTHTNNTDVVATIFTFWQCQVERVRIK